MMKVYIAAPYTNGDVAVNVRKAIDAAIQVADSGAAPYVPHLSHFAHMIHPREYEFWMDLVTRWLRECDCLIRLPGTSPGADREVEIAKELALPVFDSVDGWLEWR